jgi:hypothetical protein
MRKLAIDPRVIGDWYRLCTMAPAPPRRSIMRRFRKALLLLGILTVIVVAGLFLAARVYLASDRTLRQVEAQLAEMYGGPVAVDSVSVGMFGDSTFHGVRLYQEGVSDSPWAVFESVQTDVSAVDILLGRSPQVVSLSGAEITLSFDSDGKLLTRLPETKAKGGTLPTIHINKAKVTLRQEDRPEMVVSGIQAELRPQDGQLTLSGTITDDYWGRWSLDGKVDTAASSLLATLKTDHADVTQEKLGRLPVIPKSVWDEVSASGPTSVEFTYRHEPGARLTDGYTVVLNPDGAAIDIKERDSESYIVLIPGRDVRGRIVMEDGEVRLDGVRGSVFGGTIQTDANLDFREKEAKLDFTRLKFNDLEIAQLPADWKERVPAQFRNLGGRLTGEAKLTIQIGDEVKTSGQGTAEILGAKIGGQPVESIKLRLHPARKGFEFRPNSAGPSGALPTSPGSMALDENINRLVLIALLTALDDEPAKPSWTREATRLFHRGAVETAKIVNQSGRWLMERLPNDAAPKKPTSYLDVNLRLRDVNLAEFVKGLGVKLSFRIEGKLSLDVQASLPVDTPSDLKAYRVKGTATASRLVISGVEMKDVTAKIRYDSGVLHLDELTGALPAKPQDGTFKGKARLGVVPEGELTANLSFDRLPLSQFRSLAGSREDLSGTVSGSAEVSVPSGKLRDPNEWSVDGLVRAERASVIGLTLEKGTATVRARKGVLKITDLDATLEGAGINGSAEANLIAPYRYSVNLALKKGDLASLNKLAPDLRLPVKVEGRFALTADLDGTLSPFAVKATGSGSGSDLKIQAVRVAALRFNWKFEDSLKLTDVKATLYEGEVSGTAIVPMDAKQVGSLNLSFQNVDVGAFVRDIPAIPLKLEGTASGTIKGKSPAVEAGERTFDADLELQAPKLRVQNFPTEKLTGTVTFRKGVAEYHLKGGLLGGTFDLDGRIPPRPEPAPAKPEPEGRLRINGAQLSHLWEVYGGKESLGQLRGRVDLQLDFRHTGMDSLPVGNGKVSVQRLRWGDRELADSLAGDIVLSESELRLRDVRGTLADGSLRGSLGFNLRDSDRSWINLSLDNADASKLLAPVPDLAGVVQGSADLRLRGTIGRVWRGGGDVVLTRGTVMGIEISEWRLPVRYEWAPGRGRAHIDIDETSAQAGRGRITGRASLGMGDSTRLEGNLRFFDVEARTVLRQSLENSQIGSGRLQGRIDFSGTDVHSLNDITARVDVTMSQSQAFQFPILAQLAPLIAPGRSNETFQSGELRGRLSNGVFRVERLTLAGNTVNLFADGTVTTAGRLNLDMIVSTSRIGVSPSILRVLGIRLPPIGPIPLTLVVQVTDLLSNQVVHLRVSGTTRSPSVEIQPLPTLTDEAVRFFIGRTNIPVP